MKFLVYWRILFLIILLSAFSFDIFISIILGILLFSVIPESIKKIR